MPRYYSKEQLITHIIELKNELGRTPSLKDMNDAKNRPSGVTCQNYFGSWNGAVKKAGLDTWETYSKKKLITKIKILEKKIGHVPGRIDIDNSKKCPGVDTMIRHFGSYENAIREAGFEPPSPYVRYTEDMLIKKLKDAVKTLGHVPTTTEFNMLEGYPSSAVYIERLGWNKALKKAGFMKSKKLISDEKLLQDLKKAAMELGRTPSYSEMSAMEGYAHPRTITNRFGSFEKAVKKAELKKVIIGYSDEELRKHMADMKKRLRCLPTYDEMLKLGGPSPTTYRNHFGSWKKAKEMFQREEELTVLDNCKKTGLNYFSVRNITIELVDRGKIDEFNMGVPLDDRKKYMNFVMDNFFILCERLRLDVPYKSVSIEYDRKQQMDFLKAS